MGNILALKPIHGRLELGFTTEHQMGAADDGVDALFTGNGDGMVDNVDQSGVGAPKQEHQPLVGVQKQGEIVLEGIAGVLPFCILNNQLGVAGFVWIGPGNLPRKKQVFCNFNRRF